MLIPKQHFRICQKKLKEVEIKESKIEVKEYKGIGHVSNGQ